MLSAISIQKQTKPITRKKAVQKKEPLIEGEVKKIASLKIYQIPNRCPNIN